MSGRQARPLNRACEGTWGAGNKGMLPYLVLVFCVFVDVWMNFGHVGWGHVLVVSPPPNILYCYSTPKTTKFVSLKFLENWPLFLMI